METSALGITTTTMPQKNKRRAKVARNAKA
jgi:hypothetical protein